MNASTLETLFLRVVKTDGRSTVRLFEATPTPLEEKNLGKLFAVIELDSVNENNEHIIDLMLSHLTDAYYASEQFEIEAAFEHALHRLNEQIATIVGEVGEDWLKSCNAIFGVIHHESDLVFTHSGAILGLLSVKKQLIDIIEPDSRIAELNPLKFFGNVISGQLPAGGSVFFGTDAMMDYLSRETVRRILESDEALDAITEFQTLLSVDTHDRNFAGILMRRTEAKRPSFTAGVASETPIEAPRAAVQPMTTEQPEAGRPSADSMSSLMNREQETAELLTSSVWPTLKKSMMEYAQGVVGGSASEKKSVRESTAIAPNRFERDDVLTERPRGAAGNSYGSQSVSSDGIGNKIGGVVKQLGVFAMAGLTFLSRALVGLWGFILQLIQRARGKQSSNGYSSTARRSGGLSGMNWASVREAIVRSLTAMMRWFGRLSLLQKIFVVLAIVVFVIFSQSVVTKSLSNGSSANSDQYAEIMNQVDVKINEGKAAELLNGDSRTKYAEAKSLLATIPKDSKIYKERGAEIEKVIASELQKSNKVSDVGELQPVIDYGSISSAIRVKQMMLLGASLYAFDANNGSVYRGNLENNEVTTAISNASAGAYVAASKASPGTGMVVSNNVVSTFNPVTETITNANLSFTTTPQSLVDLTVFGNRVYTLDAGLNQIVRNRKNGDVFQGGENWLTDSSASVRDGVAMAIDGAVYVLNNNGSVSKFEGGKKSDFSLATVDPALSSGVSIATDENATNLYVADRDNKRVVVFKKTGELVNQYTSNSFEGMTDIVVDEPNKKIYVLTETGKVYQVAIQ